MHSTSLDTLDDGVIQLPVRTYDIAINNVRYKNVLYGLNLLLNVTLNSNRTIKLNF